MDDWIVCQLGARENFAVARALHRRGKLKGLITDTWVRPSSLISLAFPRRLRERWHSELDDERVWAPTLSSSMGHMCDRLRRRKGWRCMIARNLWFQKVAACRLKSFTGEQITVFSYSYAAGEIFREAKRRGWRTVLGQIDPGPVEARMVAKLYERAGQSHAHERIPDEYWARWRQEVDMADKIVVNSDWSRMALIEEGVPEDKLVTIPLAYEKETARTSREYPTHFSVERPLKMLFLGQVTLRKGIGVILEAIRLLPDLPIRLDIVGPLQVKVPKEATQDPRVTFHGPVARGETRPFYEDADIFLFPTLSDGFGLTQLEALAAGVPVIASRCCGDVVRDGVDGHILDSLEPRELAGVICELAADPVRVTRLQSSCTVDVRRFGLDVIGGQLEELFS